MSDIDINIRVMGIVAVEVLEMFKPSISELFTTDKSGQEITLFVSYSGFDIPLGFEFKKIEDKKGTLIIETPIVLKKVTQQFGVLFDEVPHGWKTISKFEFIDSKIPDPVYKLPTIKHWDDSDTFLRFC